MKASELNSTHLGQTLTLKVGHATVTDVLSGIRSHADLIDVGMPFHSRSGRRDVALGRLHLTLEFQIAGDVRADQDSEVTIHE